jgi:hypothetical protein
MSPPPSRRRRRPRRRDRAVADQFHRMMDRSNRTIHSFQCADIPVCFSNPLRTG